MKNTVGEIGVLIKLMIAKYIDITDNKPIVDVHTGHAPLVDEIITIDHVMPPEKKKFRVVKTEHVVQVPKTEELGELTKASCDTYKVFVKPIGNEETFIQAVELPMKYYGTFALIVGKRGFKESVNELLTEYLTQNDEVKTFQDYFDSLPEMPDYSIDKKE